MLDLAIIRNKVSQEKFSKIDLDFLNNIEENLVQNNSPFKHFLLIMIACIKEELYKKNYKTANLDLDLIHNLPITEAELIDWNEEYYYTVELISYLEELAEKKDINKLKIVLSNHP